MGISTLLILLRLGIGGGLYIACSYSIVGRERQALLLAKSNFPSGFQMNSRRCHLVFCAMTYTIFDLADPEKMFRPSCSSFTVSSAGVLARGALALLWSHR